MPKILGGEPFEYSGNISFEKLEPWLLAVNGSLPIWNAASNSKESFVNASNAATMVMNHYPMSADAVTEKIAGTAKTGKQDVGRRTARP